MTEKPDGHQSPKSLPTQTFLQRLGHFVAKDWLRAGFLALLAIVVHAPALSGELIWDDLYLAHDNPFIKSPLLILETFRHYLFLDSYSAHYRPVQNLSLIFDYFFWNDNTYGFHLTNVLLHATGGVLLYFLLRRLLASFFRGKLTPFTSATAAFLAALLWTVHPVHSAAVDYISGRADSLAFVFASGAWLLFLRAAETPSIKLRVLFYFLAGGSALLALCSRETASIWLAIFLIHALFFAKHFQIRGKVAILCTCVALASIYGGLRQLPERRPGPGPQPGWDNSVRAVLMMRALGDYGRLLVFPANLHMERTVFNPDSYKTHATWQRSIGIEYLSIFGLIFAALLALGCSWPGPGRRARIFGACWFVAGFLPISNLFDLNATVAEHWLYLPSVGVLLFAVGVVLDLPKRSRPILAGCAGLAVIALSLRAAERSSDWTTAEHFYERTIAAGGTSVRVSVNLGQLYAQRGEYARAEKTFRGILAAVPNFAIAQSNLANVLYRVGRKKEAEELFAAATVAAPNDRKEYPRTWLAAVNLAGIRRQKGEMPEALKILARAREDYPQIWEVTSLESEFLRQNNNPGEALELVSDFARKHWWHYGASLALGRLYAEAGDPDSSVAALQHASRLDAHEVDALNLIAQMRLRQNRLDDACQAQKRAVARQPDAPRQYILLSDILERMGQTAEAKVAIENVARLKAIGRSSIVLPN
ncbi:MAG: tetratricopeptide repeat protein [Spartobacteria bacterium]